MIRMAGSCEKEKKEGKNIVRMDEVEMGIRREDVGEKGG